MLLLLLAQFFFCSLAARVWLCLCAVCVLVCVCVVLVDSLVGDFFGAAASWGSGSLRVRRSLW